MKIITTKHYNQRAQERGLNVDLEAIKNSLKNEKKGKYYVRMLGGVIIPAEVVGKGWTLVLKTIIKSNTDINRLAKRDNAKVLTIFA